MQRRLPQKCILLWRRGDTMLTGLHRVRFPLLRSFQILLQPQRIVEPVLRRRVFFHERDKVLVVLVQLRRVLTLVETYRVRRTKIGALRNVHGISASSRSADSHRQLCGRYLASGIPMLGSYSLLEAEARPTRLSEPLTLACPGEH